MRTLIAFEDHALRAFETLTPLRGVFDLRCGALTLLERLQSVSAPGGVWLLARPELHPLLREQHPQAVIGGDPNDGPENARLAMECVFLNGRLLLLGEDFERLMRGPSQGYVILDGDVLVAAVCHGEDGARLAEFLQSCLQTDTSRAMVASGGLESWLQTEMPACTILRLADEPELFRDGSRLVAHTWELVQYNTAALLDDFRRHLPAALDPTARLDTGVQLLQASAIHLGPDVRLQPGSVLDAEDGPILVDAGVQVQPNCVIRGPAYLGPNCLIKAGARIHEGTSLGPHCKIGGEVEESVVQGFSNKQHDGFLGHAFLGEWVNLGADTNNSDLKNNYSTVRLWEDGRFVDSGQMFVGLIAGDHVKSAINTQFNTGTVVGISSQIFGAGFPPKYVPPFSWGGAEGLTTYDYARALQTARVVMARRQRELSPAYETAFRLAFERSHLRNNG